MIADYLTAASAMWDSPLVKFLVVLGVLLGIVRLGAWIAWRLLDRHVAVALAPETWDDEIDEAVALSETPLYDRIAYEMAKDFDPDAVDWTEVRR